MGRRSALIGLVLGFLFSGAAYVASQALSPDPPTLPLHRFYSDSMPAAWYNGGIAASIHRTTGAVSIEYWNGPTSAWTPIFNPSGTANTIVKFATASTIGNSSATDDGTTFTFASTTINMGATTIDMTTADLAFTNGGVITGDSVVGLVATTVNLTATTIDMVTADLTFADGAVITADTAIQILFGNQSNIRIGDIASNDATLAIDAADGADVIEFQGIAWAGADFVTIEPTWQSGTATGDIMVINIPSTNQTGNNGLLRGLVIALDNGNHVGTGNLVYAQQTYIDAEDPEAYEVGHKIESGYDVSIDAEGAITSTSVRDDFTVGHLTNGFAGTDADPFEILGASLYYAGRIDGAQTAPTLRYGTMLIDVDGTDDEGVEYIIGHQGVIGGGATTVAMSTVGTTPAMYVRSRITITSVSGTDNFYFGWRLNEAMVDNLVLDTYDTYGAIHLDATDGNCEIQTGDDTVDADDECDSTANWGDGETHVLMVVLNTDGSFEFYIDDVQLTQTTATGLAAAGDVMNPMIGLLNATDADTALTIDYVEVGVWYE